MEHHKDVRKHIEAAFYELRFAEAAIERMMMELVAQCRHERSAYRRATREAERRSNRNLLNREKVKFSPLVLLGSLAHGTMTLRWSRVYRPKNGGPLRYKMVPCRDRITHLHSLTPGINREEKQIIVRHESLARELRKLWSDHVHVKQTLRAHFLRLRAAAEDQGVPE